MDLYKLFSPRPVSRATRRIRWARVISTHYAHDAVQVARFQGLAFRAGVISSDVAGYDTPVLHVLPIAADSPSLA